MRKQKGFGNGKKNNKKNQTLDYYAKSKKAIKTSKKLYLLTKKQRRAYFVPSTISFDL